MCNCTDCTCKNKNTKPLQNCNMTPELYKYWYEGGAVEEFIPGQSKEWGKLPDNFVILSKKALYRKAKTPHVHAEVIKAWADGAAVQYKWQDSWVTTKNPGWYPEATYRIKPN